MPSLVPGVLEVADLSVDTARQSAARGGRPLRLTSKEFVMLEYLARQMLDALAERITECMDHLAALTQRTGTFPTVSV